ncbi:MAG: hypothetical protein MUE44_27965 [Oscillatoriaceae cyanobacterium Prado104]|jgi:hypothetical protein|nr:hypothetical protein [Oscillatoriaceae cyanobacterium Prado104]
MSLNQNLEKGQFLLIASIIIILPLSFITGALVGLICIFSNPTLEKNLYGIFVFFLAIFDLLLALIRMVFKVFSYMTANGDNESQSGKRNFGNSLISFFVTGIFILLIDFTLLKVTFDLYCLVYLFLWLLAFCLVVYRKWLALPEEERTAQFIEFLENMLPQKFHEEWLGDLREQHYQLIETGVPRWKVSLITLLTGLGLIRSYLWLKADKFVSRWMTRAKKVFLG